MWTFPIKRPKISRKQVYISLVSSIINAGRRGGKEKINGWVNSNDLIENWDKTIVYKTETIGYNLSKTNGGIIKIQTVIYREIQNVTLWHIW